jgi:hypothetical protein
MKPIADLLNALTLSQKKDIEEIMTNAPGTTINDYDLKQDHVNIFFKHSDNSTVSLTFFYATH